MNGSTAKRYRIVLIEDSPMDVSLLTRAFKEHFDSEFLVLSDGERAIDFLRDLDVFQPDLIILDLNLPKADGFEILSAYRIQKTDMKTPVVVFTSSSSPSDRQRIEGLGIFAFIVKPMNWDEYMALGGRFKQLLEGKRGLAES